jgi:hypothetical protein
MAAVPPLPLWGYHAHRTRTRTRTRTCTRTARPLADRGGWGCCSPLKLPRLYSDVRRQPVQCIIVPSFNTFARSLPKTILR